jgi:hypothetical protein
MEEQFKKGNLVIQRKMMMDMLCVVKCQRGDQLIIRHLDSPSIEEELIPISDVLKLAEEQERLLPVDLISAIEKQRSIVFTPPKQKGGGKPVSLERKLKGLKGQSLQEILDLIAESGTESDQQEKEEGGEDGQTNL